MNHFSPSTNIPYLQLFPQVRNGAVTVFDNVAYWVHNILDDFVVWKWLMMNNLQLYIHVYLEAVKVQGSLMFPVI